MRGGRAAMVEIARRSRVLTFAAPVEDPVLQGLRQMPGVEAAEGAGRCSIRLRYDVRTTCMSTLLAWLADRGVQADTGWRARLRHGWMAYTDAVAREGLAADTGWESSLRRLYGLRSPAREPARSDERAQHWRRYLSRTEGPP